MACLVQEPSSQMSTQSPPLQEHNLLGFRVHPGTLDDYLAFTAQSIAQHERETVLYHNLHSLYSYFTQPTLAKDYQGCKVLVDGMPLIWLMQLLRLPVSRDHRLTYVDFIMPLMQAAADNQWPVYHVGQASDVQNQALEKIRENCPNIDINGHDGYFDSRACMARGASDWFAKPS